MPRRSGDRPPPATTGPRPVPAGFFVLRTPYLPVEELLSLSEGLEATACRSEGTELEAALSRDRERVRDRLRFLCRRADVREALFLASPALERRVERWLREPDRRPDGDGDGDRRLESTLVRYLSRMAARPTPFGLFAGYSLGVCAVGPGRPTAPTRLRLPPRQAYRRRTRLDGDHLGAVCAELRTDPAVLPALICRPNPSLYEAAGRMRYIESGPDGDGRGTVHRLVAVVPDAAVRAVLGHAERGVPADRLVAAVRTTEPGVVHSEAEAFVRELVSCGLLVPGLYPAVTGAEPLDDVLLQLGRVLRRHGEPGPPGDACARAVSRVAAALRRVRAGLAELDGLPPGAEPARYRRILAPLSEPDGSAGPSHPFHVTLEKPTMTTADPATAAEPAMAVLSGDVLAELTRGVEVLHRVGGGRPDPLARFRGAFQRRYGEREVPLGEALDEEAGVGYPVPDIPGISAPLLKGLSLAAPERSGQARQDGRQVVLLRLLAEALRTGTDEIALGPAEITALDEAGSAAREPLPDAFSVLATLLAADEEAVAAGRYRLLLSRAGGPSGAALLGRFCHGDDALTARVREHLRAEEALRPDAVFAEIVHLPSGRLGNLVARPVLRDHEILCLGRSGVPPRNRIPLDDLMVRVSGDAVRLRSRRLDREVLPRLTSAHNFGDPRNLGVYRFLCDLQRQGVAGALSFSFGSLRSAPYLPRVTCGRLILSPARWNVTADRLRPLTAPGAGARFTAAQTLRERLELPRRVAIADGDSLLPVDFDNTAHVEAMARLLGRRSAATFVEVFLGPTDLLVRGPEGRFTHELVVPFTRPPSRAASEGSAAVRPVAAAGGSTPGTGRTRSAEAVRIHPPGSEWLYVKFYTGTAGADTVLTRLVRPVVRQAMADGSVDRWFFVRYGDPDWHVRLRLHGEPRRLTGEVQPALMAAAAPLIAEELVRRVQLDTYEPETSRYGGPEGVAPAERLFHADSECVLDLVALTPGDPGADARWRLALAGIDRLLAGLGLDLAARRRVADEARDRFRREFGVGPDFVHRVGDRYRAERATIERLLTAAGDPSAPAPDRPSGHALARHAACAELASAAGRLSRPLPALAGSFAHMHANRLFRSGARAHELVLYDFLSRFYASQAARRDAGRG